MKRAMIVLWVACAVGMGYGDALAQTKVIESTKGFAGAVSDAGLAERTVKELGLIGHVRMLASSESMEVRAAAKEMTQVLMQHKVEVPEELKRITVGAIPKERGDKEWHELAKAARVIESMGRLWCVKGHDIPNGAGREIFEGLAKSGPGAYVRVLAAGFLTQAAQGDKPADGMPVYETVAVDSAKRAWVQSMTACLDVSTEKLAWDAAAVLPLAAIGWGQSLALENYETGKSEEQIKDGIETRVTWVEKLAGAAEKADDSEEAKRGLAMVRKMTEYVRKQSGPMAESIVARREMAVTLRAFVAAANKEDQAEAAKHVTAKTAEVLRAQKSMRDSCGNGKGIKEIRIGSLGAMTHTGEQRQIAVELIVVDADGKEKRVTTEMPFQKVEGQWRLGER